MMRASLIYAFLALAGAPTGMAVPAAPSVPAAPASPAVPSSIPLSTLKASNESYRGVLRREDIPHGVEIRGIDDVGRVAEHSDNPAAILKRSDCNGSGWCGTTSRDRCSAAIQGYNDNTAYCGYTSRVAWACTPGGCDGCTAIYTCSNYNGHCMYGWWIKQQLYHVYDQVGCGICGTYTIPNGDVIGCRATLNFCSSCNDVG